jgi:hypothetical protein
MDNNIHAINEGFFDWFIIFCLCVSSICMSDVCILFVFICMPALSISICVPVCRLTVYSLSLC